MYGIDDEADPNAGNGFFVPVNPDDYANAWNGINGASEADDFDGIDYMAEPDDFYGEGIQNPDRVEVD